MKVTLAKSAGFCFGVKRAVEMVYKEAETGKKVYTLGPIIHNEQVVQDLEQKGVRVIDTPEELSEAEDATVIIRSHGISADVYHQLEDKKVRIVDATCPFVSKIHRIVEKKYQEGSCIVIVGNANHPEVEGINGWCNGAATVIGSVSEAENYSQEPARKLCVVAQTTFNYKKFKDLVEILRKKRYDNNVLNILNILNTICNATEERQREAKNIAGEVDTMLVVGGRHSSNTQKLFEICKEECGNTYYIQTPVDLDSEMFQCSSYVGITAGASTPKKIIEEVQEHVRIKF